MFSFLSKYSLALNGFLLVSLISSGWYIKTVLEDNGSLKENNSQLQSTIKYQTEILEEQAKQHRIDLQSIKNRDDKIKKINKDRLNGEKLINEIKVDEKTQDCLNTNLPSDYVDIL